MSGEAWYVGVYWQGRRESPDACARRFADCLRRLGDVHPALTAWFAQGMSRSAALEVQVMPAESGLRDRLAGGQIWKADVEGADTHHGFREGLWNGGTGEVEVGVSVKCGGYGPRLVAPNNCIVSLPPPAGKGTALYDPQVASAILGALIESWEPEWATFTSRRLRDAQPATGTPVMGWTTYLDARLWKLDGEIPVGVALTDVDRGILVTVGSSPLDVNQDLLVRLHHELVSLHGRPERDGDLGSRS